MKHTSTSSPSDDKIKYFCPMKCEGERVYNQPGDCPVCNMHLVPQDKKKT